MDAQRVLHGFGITGVHSMEMGPGFHSLRIFESLRAKDQLRIRVLQNVPHAVFEDALALGLHSGFGNGMLRIGSLKLFLDGALGSRTAWLREPYTTSSDRGMNVLDRAEDALVVSEQSVRVARMAGTRKDLLRARILHASVLQVRGAYAAADQELTTCAEEAEGQGWAGIAAFAYQHRGKVHYEAGDFPAARRDFKNALFLRQESGAADDQLESTLLAIDAADRRRAHASVAS